MKIISIRQPWLQIILTEGKDIENRTRPTRYRGWVALHSPTNISDVEDFPKWWSRDDALRLPRRAICAVATIVDVLTESDSKWFARTKNNYGIKLTKVTRLIKPIPFACGVQGVKPLPSAIVLQIKKQLPKLRLD
jgi:hypothetical protein